MVVAPACLALLFISCNSVEENKESGWVCLVEILGLTLNASVILLLLIPQQQVPSLLFFVLSSHHLV
ncbi:hypothetical protein Gohar_010574 [Gossypium harknessii]|uniref:Uncharacterized protein n=1 Tax=Gossypium harknessii TaxID=34285 RepID=A0A7J9GRB6_9ROSI|nr:hypothetical protein [Gossypium harknessii]